MFGTIFLVGQKLWQLHKEGYDQKALNALESGLNAFHGEVDKHHKKHLVNKKMQGAVGVATEEK